MTGPPKAVLVPTAADRQMLEVLEHLKDEKETRAAMPLLDKLIKDNPDYADGYSIRAFANACIFTPPDTFRAKSDLQAAMSRGGGRFLERRDQLALLGKIALANGEYKTALDDLEQAMNVDLDNVPPIFSIEGIVPERTSKFCTWNLTDLDLLASTFPKDWRPVALRGLYYEFFITFKEEYFPNVEAEFQKASLIAPRSPVPEYLLGELHTKASFWTKKAWASDAARDEATKASIAPYTKAIQLDPKFAPAYLARAEAYFQLKQSASAVRDFDEVLALDPDNFTAYADRGLAKMDLGRDHAAISDYGEAIRLKKDDDLSVANVLENRGDAYAKVGDFRSAIEDYSGVIERRLETQVTLLSLNQFRKLYPEYNSVPDETLLLKLNALFAPNYDHTQFVKQLTQQNGKWPVGLLNDLYEKRGDAYLRIGDFRRGVLDFQRIFQGIPNFAEITDRWRALGVATSGSSYLIDVKGSTLPERGPVQIWIKKADPKHYEVMAFAVNCDTRQLRVNSSIEYRADNTVTSSDDSPGPWAGVIPDSIGEQIWNGVCAGGR